MTLVTLYDWDVAAHGVGFPEIAEGWEGNGFTSIFSVLEGPDPHELLAVTEIVPPLDPAVVAIELEPELPLHPDGKIQE